MKPFNRRSWAMSALALAVALPGTALAERYQQVVPERSEVRFHYSQMGVPMDGRFTQFDAELDFDTAAPEQGRAVFNVALASVDAGSDEADDEVVGKAWFNAQQFPQARFESVSITPQGDGQFQVAGRLDIKGRAHDVTVPVRFVERDGQGVFEGRFTLRRADFAVGEGAWAAFDVIANDVDVSFSIVARTTGG